MAILCVPLGIGASISSAADKGRAAAAQPSPPPVLPTPPAWHEGPSALDRITPAPSLWDMIQDPIDRSTGRIPDEQTYQLDRLARQRDERLGRIQPQREFDRLQEERERRLRIEQRNQDLSKMTARQRREELDRREYELFLHAGLSPAASQAFADEQALEQAKNERDRKLIAAQNAEAAALQARPMDRVRIEENYQHQVAQIREAYEKERERILGYPGATTTTQPSAPNSTNR
jgi:hypothetical protein